MTLSKVTLHLRNSAKFVAGFLFLAVASVALAAPVKFDIPSQPAPAALLLFIKQSKVQVAYSAGDLQNVTTNTVIGKFEPSDALNLLLKDTGFSATERKAGYYTIIRMKAEVAAGSVKGSLTGEGGKGVPNVLVSIRETGQSTETDRYGIYTFPGVAAGTYVLVATAPGYQSMHITGVQVRPGSELTLGKEEMRRALGEVTDLEPFVVRADAVEQLDKFEVIGTKQKPFQDANVDIPRSINDVQPYYIFDSSMINQAGAINIEDFLKQRLSANTTYSTYSQTGNNGAGNVSKINLRGLGTSKTLILINGRHVAALSGQGTDLNSQPDVNGIPLSAIDRIEVLPSSASGIYGGSALGGVVNIILKKSYSGGEFRISYRNTWDKDSPLRTTSLTFGKTFNEGKTRIFVNAQYSDTNPLVVGDRSNVFATYYARYLANGAPFGVRPSLLTDRTTIVSTNGSALVLKSTGTSLNDSVATLPTGYTSNSNPSTIIAGQPSLVPPPTNQGPNGTLYPMGLPTKTKSVSANVTQAVTSKVTLFSDVLYTYNFSNQNIPLTSVGSFTGISALSSVNPFNNTVDVRLPMTSIYPTVNLYETTSATVGARITLPYQWESEVDYTWTKSTSSSNYAKAANLSGYAATGAINPFVDAITHPIDLSNYIQSYLQRPADNLLNDIAARASGPIGKMWTIGPILTVGLERQIARSSSYDLLYKDATNPSANSVQTYLPQRQTADNAYGEVNVPVLSRENRLPFLRALELQASGRLDRFSVTSGTSEYDVYPNDPGRNGYVGPTLGGMPISSKSVYSSHNSTIGMLIEIIGDLKFRASSASAFLPPTPAQLLPNAVPDGFTSQITDSQTNSSYDVQTVSGGNPHLLPQTSKSYNLGAIWEPSTGVFQGLRVNVEYFKIRQFNLITTLSAQQILNDPTFSSRVTRDSGTGLISTINTSYVNILTQVNSGIDFNLDYRTKTQFGTFEVYGSATIMMHDKRQSSITSPVLEYVDYVDAGGEAKRRGSATISWQRNGLTLGITARYIGPYAAYRASSADPSWNGRPRLNPAPAFGGVPYYAALQGSDHIPSQTYYDVFAGYVFGRSGDKALGWRAKAAEWLDGCSIELGVKNALNKWPPFSAQNTAYFYSYYGDIRLREYTISVRKQF